MGLRLRGLMIVMETIRKVYAEEKVSVGEMHGPNVRGAREN